MLRELIAKGFGIRKSEKALKAVIDLWRGALIHGDFVELPGGTASVVWEKPRTKMRTQVFGDRRWLVPPSTRKKKEIRFKPDGNL